MLKSKIRYRLYIQNPKTKKMIVSITSKTLEKLSGKMALNLHFNKNWYSDEHNKRCKMRLVCEQVKGKKVEELEEYTITKDWKIKGFFQWDRIK